MKKSEAKKSIELVLGSLKDDQSENRRLLESVLEGYFTPRQRKSDKVAFKEKVIKSLLKPYNRKKPLIDAKWGIEFDDLRYVYYIKGDKMLVTDKQTVFSFVGQEEIEDGYYSRKGELLKALSDCRYDIWELRLLPTLEQVKEEANFNLKPSQVDDLANQVVGDGEEHFFSITQKRVKKNFGLPSNVFKLIQQVLTEPEVEVLMNEGSSPKMVVKSRNIKVMTRLKDLNFQ